MKAKNYNNEEIIEAGLLGLEFEFYCKLKDKDIARSLAKVLDKRVVIPLSVSALGEDPAPLYHSPIEVTDNIFKLEPDFSGGKGMFELITGPVPLLEGRKIIMKVLDWIDRYGYTTERCSIHANISFDFTKVESTVAIENLDVLKFILSFDEKYVYDKFPTRKDSVYARSVESIIPNSFFFYNKVPGDWSVLSTLVVPEEKYFGINFLKREMGYLEFRYMGGKDYEKKPKKILDCVNHFALSFWDVINNPEYSDHEKRRIASIFKSHGELVKSFSNFKKFWESNKKIAVTVDLNREPEVIKTFWNRLRPVIFDLMVNSGLKEGRINLDTDFGVFQLQKAKLENARIKDLELIECEIEGIINHSKLYHCKVSNARLKDCDAVKNNEFFNSKLTEVSLHTTNETTGCYIENKTLPINCKVNSGVIRNGEIGAMADISKETAIVEQAGETESGEAPKKKKQLTPGSVQWIKNLNKR